MILAALAVAGALLGWGALLPVTATATRSALIRAPVEAVFARVGDPSGQTSWRRGLREVRLDPDGRGWTEITAQGLEIRFAETAREAPRRYALDFASPQGFSGRWEGLFESDPAGARVTLTETVTTPGLFGRILARLFAPPGAHVDAYIADLTAAMETP